MSNTGKRVYMCAIKPKANFTGAKKERYTWDDFCLSAEHPETYHDNTENWRDWWSGFRVDAGIFLPTDDFTKYELKVCVGESFCYGDLHTLSLLVLDYDGTDCKTSEEVKQLLKGKRFIIYATKSNGTGEKSGVERFRVIIPFVVRGADGERDYVYTKELKANKAGLKDYFGIDDDSCLGAHWEQFPVVKENTKYFHFIGEGDLFDLTPLLPNDPDAKPDQAAKKGKTGASKGGGVIKGKSSASLTVGEAFYEFYNAVEGERHNKLLLYVGVVVHARIHKKLKTSAFKKQMELIKTVPFFHTDEDEVRTAVSDICRKEGIDYKLS